jgi:hypothetical protein
MLENHEIISFKHFSNLADSIDFQEKQNKSESKNYTLINFCLKNKYWNYILKNNKVILEEKNVFDFFLEVHYLNQNGFLLIK